MRIHTHTYMYTCTDIVTVGVQPESSVKKEEKDFVPSPKTSVASRLPIASSGMVSVHACARTHTHTHTHKYTLE